MAFECCAFADVRCSAIATNTLTYGRRRRRRGASWKSTAAARAHRFAGQLRVALRPAEPALRRYSVSHLRRIKCYSPANVLICLSIKLYTENNKFEVFGKVSWSKCTFRRFFRPNVVFSVDCTQFWMSASNSARKWLNRFVTHVNGMEQNRNRTQVVPHFCRPTMNSSPQDTINDYERDELATNAYLYWVLPELAIANGNENSYKAETCEILAYFSKHFEFTFYTWHGRMGCLNK